MKHLNAWIWDKFFYNFYKESLDKTLEPYLSAQERTVYVGTPSNARLIDLMETYAELRGELVKLNEKIDHLILSQKKKKKEKRK